MTAILHRTVSKAWLALVGLSVLGLVPLAEAALVEVKQESSPVGHASNTEVVETGTSYQTIQPNLTSNGYVFGYWKTGSTRLADAGGRSVTQATVAVNAAMTITAHYFLADEDTDSDGVMDWFEYRNFGNLAQSSSDDADGDGFDNGQENALGQEPTIKDQVEDGGISSRTSSGFVFADTSMVHYVLKSDPVGFVSGTDGYMEVNATVSTSNLHGATNGYHFAYWTVNGVRIAGPTGVAMSQVSATMEGETTIVANYVSSSEDVDSDGVMDWYELNQFGNLSSGPSNDSDGDGFTNEQESSLGQEATIKDQVEDGGISSRTSSGFVFADNSMVHYEIKSDPIGFITTSDGYVEVNATVSTSNLHGAVNGYDFGYWTVNGVRIAGPTGVAMSQVSAKLAGETAIVAHYFPSGEDFDSDGVMDWYELNQFGNLAGGPSNDSDGDGFSNEQESALGQEATIKDQVEDGGISSRASGGVLYFMQVNKVPDDLDLNASTTIAGKPAGLTVGTFTPHDDDDPNAIGAYDLSLVDGNGSTDNAKFAITGRNLKTNALLALGTYSIRVRVADDENASFQKTFAIQAVPDPNKDDDNDTLTYAQEQALGTSDDNPDSDGDGFSDGAEVLAGTNPANANSKPNQAPTAIDLNGTSVAENQVAGTVIGHFTATDPDANSSHVLTFTDGNGSQHNNLFTLDANGTLSTAATFDYETNATALHVRVKATDEHNASLAKAFVINVTNVVEDLDGDGIEDHADADDDGDGFSDVAEIAYGSDPRNNQSVANQAPTLLDLNGTSVPENSPTGFVVGMLNATDPDANATITLTFADGNGSQHNNLFTLDANGTLRTTATFDYETNATALHIRIKATDEHNASLAKTFAISLLNVNEPPADLNSTASLSISENQPIETIVGEFNATDADANSNLTFTLVEGSNDNHLFAIDANGTLRTVAVFDYETNATFTIRAKVRDQHNAWIKENFTVTVTNVVEDLDGDGIEDHADPDDDGDGFSDAEEIAYGSDHRNAQSVANQAPTLLDLNGSSVTENQPSGTTVGKLNATDPDANATITLAFTDGNGSQHNNLFTIDANGTLRTATTFDFESNGTSLAIRLKATDENNASLEKTFTVNVMDDLSDNPVVPDANATLPDANATLPEANATLPDANASFIPEGNETLIATAQLPIVRTLIISRDEAGALVFSGKILHDGNASLTKVGFLLQQSLASHVEDQEPVKLEAVLVGDEFAITVETSTVGQSFYYRAFAENAAGLSMGTSKRFSLSASDSSNWWTGIPRSDGGWRASGWFGSFLAFENGWLYHEHLGWLYSVGDGAGNLWLWSEFHGWLWTGEDLFPYLYRNHDQAWIYFLKNKNSIPRFYNHATKQVE